MAKDLEVLSYLCDDGHYKEAQMKLRWTLAVSLFFICMSLGAPLPSHADPMDKAAKETEKQKMTQEREAQKKRHEMEREAQKDKHAMEREDRKHKEEMARENEKHQAEMEREERKHREEMERDVKSH